MGFRLSGWLVLVIASAMPLRSYTYIHVSDSSLASQAEVIARVEVLEAEIDDIGPQIWTRQSVRVEELVKGEVDGDHVTVRLPGGRSDRLGLELRYSGTPAFERGDRALLFLRRNDDGTHRVLHLALGAFWERVEKGEPVFVRPLPEPEESAATHLKVARDAGRFVEWLRDETAGRPRERDYLIPLESDARPALAKFTIFDVFQAWEEFQIKPVRQVGWQRHRIGQKGVPGKGKRELKNVFDVLNGTADSRGRPGRLVDLALEGRVSNIPAERCSGDNLFIFDDATGVIGDPFSCSGFGPLAVGSSCRFIAPSGEWKGRDVHHSSSARVVFNKGTECYYRGDFPFDFDTARNKFGEVAIHEVMHTLGLVHSCGDSRSPSCDGSPILDDATMRARAHADGRGAELRDDDLAGFWFLYDPDFLAAPCHLPPGDRNFCKRCGPCGEGQGACRRNNQCFDGLKCRRDSAAGFKTCQ